MKAVKHLKDNRLRMRFLHVQVRDVGDREK